MEPQENYVEQIEMIYNARSPRITTDIVAILKQCKKKPEELEQLLDDLVGNNLHSINFHIWADFARMLAKACVSSKLEHIKVKAGRYFVKAADYFFPYTLNSYNYKNFQPLLKISAKVLVEKPETFENQRHVIMHLNNSKFNQDKASFTNDLLQVINNEVLVDKKNQNPKAIKINPWFTQFICANFDKLVPSLERLMIRSESNIEVLVEFLQMCGDLDGIGEHSLALMKKYKNLFLTRTDHSLRLVKVLTESLSDENEVYSCFELIKSLIASEHNAKKKIIYFRMLEGCILSLEKYPQKLSQKIVNEVVATIATSWIKFIEESQANYVLEMLEKILPLVQTAGPEIAECCKQSLKNQNKYILLFTSLTLSYCYNDAHYFEEFGSVKQCFSTLKSLLPTFMKKKEANWHFILPTIKFLSTLEVGLAEQLMQIASLFKKSCLALTKIQQQNAIDLIVINYIKYLHVEAENQSLEFISLSDQLCITLVVLLEENNLRRIWQKIIHTTLLTDDFKLQLIQKAIYPLTYLEQNTNISTKNKGNKYISLTREFLLKGFKNKIVVNMETEKYVEALISVSSYSNTSLFRVFDLSDKKIWEEENAIVKVSKKYLHLCLLPLKIKEQNEKTWINEATHSYHMKILSCIFELRPDPLIPEINKILSKILDKKYYEIEKTFIQGFENQLKVQMNSHFSNAIADYKATLTEMELYTEPKMPIRKIFLNPIFDAKMMSEAEVKEEQYREHLNQMLWYFHQICEMIMLPNMRKILSNADHEEGIWDANFEGFVHIVQYPEHRIGVQRIVKASFEFIGLEANKQSTAEEIKKIKALNNLFLKYSNFFGYFYAIRGAHLTPSVNLMGKAHRFFDQFLEIDHTALPLDHYALKFVNDLSFYILENMEFDLSVKEQALNFCYESMVTGNKKIAQKETVNNEDLLFSYLIKNLNIISKAENIEAVLEHCMKRIDTVRYGELFVQILNYINNTKRLVLRALLKIACYQIEGQKKLEYEPSFEDYIKLRILSLDDSTGEYEEISKSSQTLLELFEKYKSDKSIAITIADFDMKNFIKNNSKETTEKLCKFMTESITPANVDDVFKLVLSTAELLYDENFDQQGLEFLPYFFSLNMEIIPEKYLHKIFEILVLKYTANENYVTLSRMSVDIGVDIIKKYANKYGDKMLLSMESFLTKAKGITNIVFLGVLAPYLKGNKNLNIIEKRITELFKGDSQNQQRAIAKSMPDLMSFFKNPEEIVAKIFEQIHSLEQKQQIGQSYLAAGLLKGLGPKSSTIYLQKIISKEYPSKSKSEKTGRIALIRAFVQTFGRVIELKGLNVVQILLHYMSDAHEEVRGISKSVAQIFVTKMSSHSIKQLLPPLLSGLQNQQNWRIKISYIWILGIMANCAAKQLQTSLPIIVPTLSACLSNAHPAIRDKAAEALNLIGETIKNPEISQSIDILIEALQNPFEKSGKALDVLLKTRFSHYIDPPSLSIIVPIIDYCLRGRNSQLKEGACQVIGSITELILNPSDMLPYLKIVATGIKTTVCDPLPEIRSIAAMAIGKISSKIGADAATEYFGFIFELINSSTSNTTQKTGAAQSYAQLICSQDYDYFEECLNSIFSKLTEDTNKSIQKEGYILVFLYVPTIRRSEFESFIKEVNESIYSYVSDEDEALRNSSMQVSKVLINNYGISHTELLLEPLCQGIFQENWRKRNAALILLGQLLNILKLYMFHNKTTEKMSSYYQALMAVYIMKDDQLEMPRVTANQVWNLYIENTPKTIKSGLPILVRMWALHTHDANGVVFKNIIGFSGKYGENYFSEILENLEVIVAHSQYKKGVFEVLTEFFKRMAQQFLSKNVYRSSLRRFFETYVFSVDDSVRQALSRCFALYVEKMHEQQFFEGLIYPQIDKMGDLSEENPAYTETLHLMRDLLNTSSSKVVDRLISKVTSSPLSEFKIEVITNNADKIANNLFILFPKKPATEGMFEEILYLLDQQPEKANRLSLLVYCLNQVSIRLNSKYKTIYINMLINKLRSLKNHSEQLKTYLPAVDKILEMLVFFLHSISLNQIDSMEELIGVISPFIFIGNENIKSNAHRIFLILVSDHKASQTGVYYRQMIVSLENVNEGRSKDSKTIWTEQEIIQDYISAMVQGLAYGNNDNLESNLELIKFFMKNTDQKILTPLITRILGPIIRVASYSLYQRQKEKLLLFIKDLYEAEYTGQLEIYNYQVVSVCLRILNENKAVNKRSHEMTEQIASTLFSVLANQSSNKNRELLLDFIIAKAKGEGLVEVLHYLIEKIIQKKPEILPKSTYIKIETQFYTQLINTESKMSVRGTYLLAKVVAMISTFLKEEENQNAPMMTYEDILLYLQKSKYKKQAVPKMEKIQLLIRQSPRQKVYYLLKSLQECREVNTRTEEIYTHEYVKSLIPENLSGFEDITQILEYFE